MYVISFNLPVILSTGATGGESYVGRGTFTKRPVDTHRVLSKYQEAL